MVKQIVKMMLIFTVLIVAGLAIGEFILDKDDGYIKIKDVAMNPENYFNQTVELWGTARYHSSRDWIKLEDRKGNYIYVRHDIPDAYFKYGDKYVVKGKVYVGEVFAVPGNSVFVAATEAPVRNNTWSWLT